jgi:hypothetical protein
MPKSDELQKTVQVGDLEYGGTYTLDGTNYQMADASRSWMPPASKQGSYPHAAINGNKWDHKQRLTEFHVTKPFGGIAGNCAHYYFSVDFNGAVALTNIDPNRVGTGHQGEVNSATQAMTRFAQAFISAAFQKASKADAGGWTTVG